MQGRNNGKKLMAVRIVKYSMRRKPTVVVHCNSWKGGGLIVVGYMALKDKVKWLRNQFELENINTQLFANMYNSRASYYSIGKKLQRLLGSEACLIKSEVTILLSKRESRLIVAISEVKKAVQSLAPHWRKLSEPEPHIQTAHLQLHSLFSTPNANVLKGSDCTQLVKMYNTPAPHDFLTEILNLKGQKHLFQFHYNPLCEKGKMDFFFDDMLHKPLQTTEESGTQKDSIGTDIAKITRKEPKTGQKRTRDGMSTQEPDVGGSLLVQAFVFEDGAPGGVVGGGGYGGGGGLCVGG
ncbi:hypothetical protein Tco_0694516 [Tanacetum coccineum]